MVKRASYHKETKYVAYYRVSTKKQGKSGLGLEAQRETVQQFIKSNGNRIIAEFTEIESGKNDERPELLTAIEMANQQEATLVIAKLDRLSRSMAFITTLMDTDVKFVCCDMPKANELKTFYDNLSDHYGFEIVPLEDSFYASQTLLGTIRRLERQGRMKELMDILKLSIEYYPNSVELNNLISKYD